VYTLGVSIYKLCWLGQFLSVASTRFNSNLLLILMP